ncbi:uncharacterized protein LTR77_006990 [Saxophila tyrrhenica]|uniref:Deacetylase sirtuin-type domain-containing protein n=1 Tax=Saxophila tyrrhenica TaxID=1690608 RepID=A0AAV9P9U0_9PEZI|nr:hypothetical protein LTR77_006990 [Saxophila tyrrhenica]
MDVDAMADSSALSSPLSSAPSSPLSSPGNTPPPPPGMGLLFGHYPSPPTSQGSRQTSNTTTPTPDGMDSSASTDKEGPPPAKRRRISKERTTEYLDLRGSEIEEEQQAQLDQLLHVLHNRQKIVVIAGAGISVSAGIPDFRSSTGLFKSLKDEHKLKGSGKHLFDASVYKDDTSTSTFHEMIGSMSRTTRDAKPTAFHHMLATIAKEDRLLRLYSQNVDGIDTSLPPLSSRVPLRKDEAGKWPRTVQLHGGLDKMVCSKCHDLSDFDAALFSGPVPPLCPRCEEINDIRTNHEGKRSHGIGRLRPRMVLYNEHNPDDIAIGAVTRDDLRKRPDAVIVAGTTLKVPGVRRIVREMCASVRDRRGGVAIWINNDLPPVAKDLEECFDIVVQGKCDEVASKAAMPRWDEPSDEDNYAEVSDEQARKSSSVRVEVRIPACTLPHAEIARLPSEEHLNNSFPPPPSVSSTPRKPLSSPVDWSPMPSRNNSIVQSIEVGEDNIEVKGTGLLTPTKSQKSSPEKVAPLKLSLKVPDKAKQASSKATKKSTLTAKPKKSNVKYVKPAKKSTTTKSTSTAKSKPKPGKKAQAAANTKPLTNSFKVGKSAAVSAEAKKAASKGTTTPSKLRQVSNASEPMLPVSPSDRRNNTSPSKKTPRFPGLMSENLDQSVKKRLFT